MDDNRIAFEAYNQAIEDAKQAIRTESQGGGYWAAAFINAIARRCSPHVYANRLAATAATAAPAEQSDASYREVAQCAQAVLTALNVGDVKSGSLLHLKLREVMIAYRERAVGGPVLADERVDAFIREHENDPADGPQLERVRQLFNDKLAATGADEGEHE